MQIGIIKEVIKKALRQRLPTLPEYVETELYFQGRGAWVYSWRLKDVKSKPHIISVEVDVKLKNEFVKLLTQTRFTFLCQIQPKPDIYNPKVTIHQQETLW
ncbi:conserved hypothetical protein [Gammaproteobacteria bacterium]